MEADDRRKRLRIAVAVGLGVSAIVLGLIPIFYDRVREWTGDRGRNTAQAKEAIEAVLTTQVAAWNAGDLDGYMAGYWDSPELEFVSDTTTKGFQPVKDRYFQRYKAQGKEMGTLTFEDLSVTVVSPQDAEVTGKWKVVKTTETVSGGFVVKLKKFENGWKIVRDTTTSDVDQKK